MLSNFAPASVVRFSCFHFSTAHCFLAVWFLPLISSELLPHTLSVGFRRFLYCLFTFFVFSTSYLFRASLSLSPKFISSLKPNNKNHKKLRLGLGIAGSSSFCAFLVVFGYISAKKLQRMTNSSLRESRFIANRSSYSFFPWGFPIDHQTIPRLQTPSEPERHLTGR
ncbi:hypothetical protein LINGRAHAP2_LOCUS8427 [Linum grandiflorum]